MIMWAYAWAPTMSELILAEREGEDFYGVGEHIDVKYVDILEVRKIVGREMCDGSFNGCYNQAYELTDAQKDEILAINNERARQKRVKTLKENIDYYEKKLATIKPCSKEEAVAKLKRYNDTYNEGGYGYTPHYYTYEEYDNMTKELERCKKELSELTSR